MAIHTYMSDRKKNYLWHSKIYIMCFMFLFDDDDDDDANFFFYTK